MLNCWQREINIGVATAMTMEVKQGRMVRDALRDARKKTTF